MKNLSKIFCLRNSCLILYEDESVVKIGFVKADEHVQERLRRYFKNKKVLFESMDADSFDILVKRMGTPGAKESRIERQVSDPLEEAKKAPVVNLTSSILGDGIRQKVSDIHIEVCPEKCTVRFRKDGELFTNLETDCRTGRALIGRIKLLSGLNILEHRKCQDGRFDFFYGEKKHDVRVSCLPSGECESVALRILGGGKEIPQLEELGFSKTEIALIRSFEKLEKGLVLVTGSTGMGKTTTLASILCEMEKQCSKIITIEDPVEYTIPGTVQIQVDETIGKTFPEVLKRILRHDPDILLIGEIRDEETASFACRLALTGHLVFGTLHTGSAEETVTRLMDLGTPPYILCDVLKGVIGQKLVQKESGGRTVKAEIRTFDAQSLRNLLGELK
ncbi:MAG: Flp pilus assembly complex ATPase component TadA [Treponema sp.]|nr:Flp pilus assembly complex ATPase component TadA [Treponema sp.]